jgi:hypothetical protein
LIPRSRKMLLDLAEGGWSGSLFRSLNISRSAHREASDPRQQSVLRLGRRPPFPCYA